MKALRTNLLDGKLSFKVHRFPKLVDHSLGYEICPNTLEQSIDVDHRLQDFFFVFSVVRTFRDVETPVDQHLRHVLKQRKLDVNKNPCFDVVDADSKVFYEFIVERLLVFINNKGRFL